MLYRTRQGLRRGKAPRRQYPKGVFARVTNLSVGRALAPPGPGSVAMIGGVKAAQRVARGRSVGPALFALEIRHDTPILTESWALLWSSDDAAARQRARLWNSFHHRPPRGTRRIGLKLGRFVRKPTERARQAAWPPVRAPRRPSRLVGPALPALPACLSWLVGTLFYAQCATRCQLGKTPKRRRQAGVSRARALIYFGAPSRQAKICRCR